MSGLSGVIKNILLTGGAACILAFGAGSGFAQHAETAAHTPAAAAQGTDHAAEAAAETSEGRDIGHRHTQASEHDDHGATDSHAADSHGADAHGADAHGAGGHEEAPIPEIPSLLTLILNSKDSHGHAFKHTHFGHFLHTWEKQIYMIVNLAFLSFVIFGTLRLRHLLPGKLQTLLEMIVEGFFTFIFGILGEKNGRRYTPFLASLFVFIWVNNIVGIVPLMAAPTSKFQTTVALALIVFFYIHFQGIKEAGLWHWFHHLLGAPKDALGWAMAPLMLPLEIIGTLAKPLSLSLRLFGNIMGEDILVGVFLMMGMMLMGIFWPDPMIGVPLHLPFFFLALLTCTIQALVFMLLSTIYLMMLLPHHEHEHDEHHEDSNWHAAHKPEVPGLPEDKGPHVGVEASPFA